MSDAQRILTLRSGDEQLALPAQAVMEVVRTPHIARVPHAPPGVRGIANLRGAVLPILSLAILLGRPQEASTASTRVLVLNRATPVGLLVDEVTALTTASALGEGGTLRPLDVEALLQGSLTAARPQRAERINRPAQTEQTAAAIAATADLLTLVSFNVGRQIYAIPLDQAREIIALPEEVAIPSRAGDVAAGVISWRGKLLPLVSARALLGHSAEGFDTRRARILVIRAESRMIGLVADGMREILRVPSVTVDPVPAMLRRSHGGAEIEAIARLEGGKRLVSILATSTFLAADHGGGGSQTDEDVMDARAVSAGSSAEQFIVFTLGAEHYGLPIAAVEEVVRLPDNLTRLPRAPDFIEGVMNLRGKVLPIIDQARRFGVSGGSPTRRRRVMILRLDDMRVGFVVDTVSEIIAVPADRLSPAPDFGTQGAPIFDRVAHRQADGAIILLVDPRELLDRTERDLMAVLKAESAAAPV